MSTDRFITLVIHTYDRAVTLRKILESHGIDVKFENLVISGMKIASAVRVKINEKDLPLALKITESGDSYSQAKLEMKMNGESGKVLIPVDFSEYSLLACRVGFDLAKRLGLQPVLLYCYASPYFTGNLAYSNVLDPAGAPELEDDVAQMEVTKDMRSESEKRMDEFRHKLEDGQQKGELPTIKFQTQVSEGIPEEVITEYCRLTPPALIVMATRGKAKREHDLIGSVTAEVLDSCQVPIFAIPENYSFSDSESIKKLVYFCNLDQHDIVSVDTLMRMFDYPEVEVTLIPVNERAGNKVKEKVKALAEYFNKNYPAAHFTTEVIAEKDFRKEFEEYIAQAGIELFIVPNKKKNIFSRLFNPGIAHKMLFERDMPLLALPV